MGILEYKVDGRVVFIKEQDYHKSRHMMDNPLVSIEVVDDLEGFINLTHQIMENKHIGMVSSQTLQHPIYIEYIGLGKFFVWFWTADGKINRINNRGEFGVNYNFTSLEAAATKIFTLLTSGRYESISSNM